MKTFHVLVVGPEGCGKTTLLSSIVTAATRSPFTSSLGGLRLEPEEEALERAHSHGAAVGTFLDGNASTVPATERHVVSDLKLVQRRALLGTRTVATLRLHDIPGSLVEDLPRMTSEVVPLSDVDVLVVAMDAAMLMAAHDPGSEGAALVRHKVFELEELMLEWEKVRPMHGGGLLLLVPVKCEGCYADRGVGRNDEEGLELARRICDRYVTNAIDLISVFGGSDIHCLYLPADTAGRAGSLVGKWTNTEGLDYVYADAWKPAGEDADPFGCDVILLAMLETCLSETAAAEGEGGAFSRERAMRGALDAVREELSRARRERYARGLRIC